MSGHSTTLSFLQSNVFFSVMIYYFSSAKRNTESSHIRKVTLNESIPEDNFKIAFKIRFVR